MFKQLIEWSLNSYRDLPWRKNRSVYGTLVSEVMLQQTTVATVIQYFDPFLKKYPTLLHLAESTEDEIQISWKGLGYYRRARNLHQAAQHIVKNCNQRIPMNFRQLVEIPGIGQYTANALLAIGANRVALALDANLERVLSRIFLIEGVKGPQLQKRIYRAFAEKSILSDMNVWGPRNLTEALMDLGRTFCRANKAECPKCPMQEHCLAYKQNRVFHFPQLPEIDALEKYSRSFNLGLLRVIVRKRGRILVYKKSSEEWLSGQWEPPTYIISSDDPNLKQYPWFEDKDVAFHKEVKSFKSSITKYRITNYVWELSEDLYKKHFTKFEKNMDFRPIDVEQENFASNLLKILKIIETKKIKETNTQVLAKKKSQKMRSNNHLTFEESEKIQGSLDN